MIPNKIKVAGIEYDVVQVDNLANDHGLGGQILYEKGVIKIDSGMCKDKKEQVLIHETLHSIFNEAGYTQQDEDMVNRLGIVLYQVIKDNKFNFDNTSNEGSGTIVKVPKETS